MKQVTCNKDPKIVSYDDAAAIHREIWCTDPVTGAEAPYDHCIRVSFAEPFAAYDYITMSDAERGSMFEDPEYEAARVAYEAYAVRELGIELKEPYTLDWRDEAELWIRYND